MTGTFQTLSMADFQEARRSELQAFYAGDKRAEPPATGGFPKGRSAPSLGEVGIQLVPSVEKEGWLPMDIAPHDGGWIQVKRWHKGGMRYHHVQARWVESRQVWMLDSGQIATDEDFMGWSLSPIKGKPFAGRDR